MTRNSMIYLNKIGRRNVVTLKHWQNIISVLLMSCLIGSPLAAQELIEEVIYSDTFENNTLDSGWFNASNTGKVEATTKDSYQGSYSVRIKRGATLQRTIPVSGYTSITIDYMRKTKHLDDDDEFLTVQWSTDQLLWHTLEVSQYDDWQNRNFTFELAELDNIYLRFDVTSKVNSEKAFIDNLLVTGQYYTASDNPNLNSVPWSYENGGSDLVAAARYAGLYALGDRASNSIAIYNIEQQKIAEINEQQISALLAEGSNIQGENYGPASLAFSASGRLLFIAVNVEGDGSSGNTDAVLQFNSGTKTLTRFIENVSLSSSASAGNLGMLHHQGELWLGTGGGQVLRFQAQGNDSVGQLLNSYNLAANPSSEIVGSITVDSMANTAYIGTATQLYRLNFVNQEITAIATVEQLKSVTYGRNFGGAEQGGLYLLSENANGIAQLSFVDNSSLKQNIIDNSALLPSLYSELTQGSAIAATADGKILVAGETSTLLNDITDTRMSYSQWLRNEYDQYITFIRSACWPEGVREGWVSGTEPKPDQGRYRAYSTGASGWAALMLMTDEAMFGQSAEAEVQAIITRFAGLHPDGIGPEVTTDGLYYGDYYPDTGLKYGYPSIYSTAKMVNAAIYARKFYPNNAIMVTAANKIIGMQKNYADYLRDYAKVELTGGMYGPEAENTLQNTPPYQESYLFSELAAAQDPMAVNAYEDWWKHHQNHDSKNDYLTNEPVIKWNISSFVEQYGHIVFKDRRENADWRANFNNLYAHYGAWTDDNNPDYLTVFSAGATETQGYNADKINHHPNTITHFPGVLGFGMYGNSAPMVAGYFAYRDGARQKMKGKDGVFGPNVTIGAEILTRYSNENPSWELNRLAIPDMVFGLYGLVEQLTDDEGNKGIIDRLIARDASPEDFAVHESYGHSASSFETQGQLMNVVNGQFSSYKDGWTTLGTDFLYYAPNVETQTISGRSGEIRSTTSMDSSAEFGRFQQTIDMSAEPSLTPFILRGDGKIYFAGAEDQSYLKIEWDEDNDPNNTSAFSAQYSDVLDADDYATPEATTAEKSFDITTRKPVGANFVHVSFEVKRNLNVAPKYIRYFFDNLTMRRLRIDLADALDGAWSSIDGVRATVIVDGDSANFLLRNGTNKDDESLIYRDFLLATDDPLGTRYVVTGNIDTANIEDAELLVYVEIRSSSDPTYFRQEGGDVVNINTSSRDIYYSGRRLEAHEDQLRVFIRFKKRVIRAWHDQTATLHAIDVGKQAPSF